MTTASLQCPFALDQDSLKDQVILVVGALGGIGQAVALEIAQRGAELILLDRGLKELEKMYDHFMSLQLPEPALHEANLMTLGPSEARHIAHHIQKLYGALDGLVFCSGFWGSLTPIEHYQEKMWLEVMHLNVNMPFLLTKYMLPLLKQSDNSHIVFTESPMSTSAKAYHGPFCSSQSALASFREVLASELAGQAPFVVGLNPQAVQTKQRANTFPGLPGSGYLPKEVASFYSAMLVHGQEYHGQLYSLPPYQE